MLKNNFFSFFIFSMCFINILYSTDDVNDCESIESQKDSDEIDIYNSQGISTVIGMIGFILKTHKSSNEIVIDENNIYSQSEKASILELFNPVCNINQLKEIVENKELGKKEICLNITYPNLALYIKRHPSALERATLQPESSIDFFIKNFNKSKLPKTIQVKYNNNNFKLYPAIVINHNALKYYPDIIYFGFNQSEGNVESIIIHASLKTGKFNSKNAMHKIHNNESEKVKQEFEKIIFHLYGECNCAKRKLCQLFTFKSFF
jgi:hypothetical protein